MVDYIVPTLTAVVPLLLARPPPPQTPPPLRAAPSLLLFPPHLDRAGLPVTPTMSTGAVAWPLANATAAAVLGPGVVVESISRNYLWVVIVGGILAFGMVRSHR